MAIEEKKEIPLGMREIYPHPAMDIADCLKEQGVEVAFGVHGGHYWPVMDAMSNAGIKLVTVHHEQTGVYAAEGYARATGKVGVAYATVGPGVGNAVSAVQQAYLNCSPMVLILSGHESPNDKTYALQESYAEDLLRNITKWTRRIRTTIEFKRWITKAFKDAQSSPKGPVALEFCLDTIFGGMFPPPPSLYDQHHLYAEKWRGEETPKPFTVGGDPQLVEKATKLIYEAKRPIIFAADGLHWSEGGPQLVEFAELAQVPVIGRRIARGAIPEAHPLNLSSRIAGRVVRDSDLVIAIGMKVGGFDGHGRAWPRCIQINESPEHIWTYLEDTEVAIVGTASVVLSQMLDYAKAHKLKPPQEREEWNQRLYAGGKEADLALQARADKYRDHKPIHYGWLSKVIWDTCEDLYGGMNRVVMDGFTFASYAPAFIKCRYNGQYIDCGEQAGVGHGIGMAIGAAFGDPETKKRPIVALMGDAGMGLAGFDVETALRCNLPIVYIVSNNNGWLTGMKYLSYGKNWEALGPQDQPLGEEFLPDIRYEKLSEVFGCHGEYVTEPDQIRPALERAFRAAENGKTAVVNVIVDGSITSRQCYTLAYAVLWGQIPWDKLPKRGKAIRRNLLFTLPWDEAGVPPMPMPDPWEPVSEEELTP
jgi:thiamine pyrophosphate-dependent acetolactate synthase large subunit-like protein